MAALTVAFSGYGVVQAAVGAIVVSGVAGPDTSPQAQMSQMREQVERMQADVQAAKEAAKLHAARVERQQALISAVLSGKVDRAKIEQPLPPLSARTSAVAEEVLQPLRQLEARQLALARARARRRRGALRSDRRAHPRARAEPGTLCHGARRNGRPARADRQ